MKPKDPLPLRTIKITKEPTPRHPDPLVINSALRASLVKIKSASC